MKIKYKKNNKVEELEADFILLYKDEERELYNGDWVKLMIEDDDYIICKTVLNDNPLEWYLLTYEYDYKMYYPDETGMQPAFSEVRLSPSEVIHCDFEIISEDEAKKLFRAKFDNQFPFK